MTREWAQFWVAITVMTVAATTAVLASTGVSVGTIGEWVGGLGAFAAAGVALWIADHQTRLSRTAAEQSAADRAENTRAVQLNIVSEVVLILMEVLQIVDIIRGGVAEKPEHRTVLIPMLLGLPRVTALITRCERLDFSRVHDPLLLMRLNSGRSQIAYALQRASSAALPEIKDGEAVSYLDFALVRAALRNLVVIQHNLWMKRGPHEELTPDQISDVNNIMASTEI